MGRTVTELNKSSSACTHRPKEISLRLVPVWRAGELVLQKT